MASYTYLLINVFSILIPLLNSFNSRVYFIGQWKAFSLAIVITGAFFITWDVVFTQWGVWGFSDKYLTGITLINLPIEEWLFFITIPYACIFTYEALGYYIKKDYFGPSARTITWFLLVSLLVVSVLNSGKMYTFTTGIFTSLFLILHLILRKRYLGRFYLSYLVILIPFSIVNGLLTGSWIEDQVVWYNDQQNLSLRLGTIPVEDTVYGLLLIMMNVTLYEYFKKKF